MPETRKYETNEMVDIDNSGPEVDVTLPEDKKEEVKDEQVVESNEPIIEEVKTEEPQAEPEQKTEEPVKEEKEVKVQEDKNPEDKINIMRDSQIGVYGTLELIIAISLKAFALTELINKDPFFTCIIALIVSGTLSRSTIVGIAFFLEKASETGLASFAGKPRATGVGVCFLISILICIFLLPLTKLLAAILLSIVTTVVIGFLSKKQINGYTGDILGTTQVFSETAILIYLATSKM